MNLSPLARSGTLLTVCTILSLLRDTASGQNLLPNSSFETGLGAAPPGWLLSLPGGGAWVSNNAYGGNSSLLVNGVNGQFVYWAHQSLAVQPGGAYLCRLRALQSNNVSGYMIAGFSSVSYDLLRPGSLWSVWTSSTFPAWLPTAGATPSFRFGLFDAQGGAWYDDVEVFPLQLHRKMVGNYALGAGESLFAGRYTNRTVFELPSGNYTPYIVAANTTFNSFKWYLQNGQFVAYRHVLPGTFFTSAEVKATIQNYNGITSKSLRIEASTNGSIWTLVGEMDGATTNQFIVPAALLPTAELHLRFSTTNALQFGFTGYTLTASVADTNTAGQGESYYLGQVLANTNIWLNDLASTPEGQQATVAIVNTNATPATYAVVGRSIFSKTSRERRTYTTVNPGETNFATVIFPTSSFGENDAVLSVEDTNGVALMQSTFSFKGSIISDDSYGETLVDAPDFHIWWCDGTYRVGANRLPPAATNAAATVAVARNEYEPIQIVLRPKTVLSNVTASITDFVSTTNPAVRVAATNVTIEIAGYVPIKELDPRDTLSVLGLHADPLEPIAAPLTAAAGTNLSFFVTVYVPRDSAAGEYAATFAVQHAAGSFSVPVKLRVFNFTLPGHTEQRNAAGLYEQEHWYGFNWATPEQMAQVWELNMLNLAKHRISPYYPQSFARIQYTYHPATDSFTYNFDAFDAAMDRYIEEYNFNSFRDLHVTAALPPIPGVAQYNAQKTAITPEYRRLYIKLMQPIFQHFRERGWMGIAYSQWIDEPTTNQTPLVRQGMDMIQEAAPDQPRLLASLYSPDPNLFGYIDEWVPNWDFGLQTQFIAPLQAAGDRVWYYVATVPKTPWPNNFVDQPAIGPRIRQWYAEKQGFVGEDYWTVNWWADNNPWENPMTRGGSASDGYFKLGNGDGVMIYPPAKSLPTNTAVVLPPVNSIRMATSRDGYEDREYFMHLKRLLSNSIPVLGESHPAILEAQDAIADALDPLPWTPLNPYEAATLFAARQRVAEAIEALETGAPRFAKSPWSKVVREDAAQTLRVEAIGWPPPQIQWQHQGTNLPGAIGPRLSLTNITPAMAGEYRAIAWNAQGSVTSAVGRLTVLVTNMPPVVITHPKTLTRTNGARAVFGAGVSSLTPLTYQWLHNGVPLPAATNVTVVVSNISLANAGSYALVASNAFGVATSSPALLQLDLPGGGTPPAITGQPTNQSVLAGASAAFAVTATGSAPLTYQWFFNTTNPVGGNVNPLVLPNVQPGQAGQYRVVVANAAGSVTSAVATLTVELVAPVITTPPTNLTVVQGQGAQFTVAATGSLPLAFQWFFNETNLLAGATGTTLSLTNVQPAQVGNYVVRITNFVGAVTSAPALLQIAGLPHYTNEPPGLAVAWQDSALVLTLPPDNRARTIQVSTNLLDWEAFTNAGPSAVFVTVPVAVTNLPGRFFRVFVVP